MIMKAMAVAGSLACMVLVSGSANAQARDNRANPDFSGSVAGMRMRGAVRPDIDTPDGLRTYSAMLVTGKCLAGIGRKGFTAAFDNDLNTPAERQDVVLLQQRLTACTSPNNPNILSLTRGSITEALYRKENGNKVEPPLTEAQIVDFELKQRPRLAHLEPVDRGLAMVSDCLVVRQPEQARKVLQSDHGSKEELAAMEAMFAASPQCSSNHRPANVSRPFLRAFIANSSYRLQRWREQTGKSAS